MPPILRASLTAAVLMIVIGVSGVRAAKVPRSCAEALGAGDGKTVALGSRARFEKSFESWWSPATGVDLALHPKLRLLSQRVHDELFRMAQEVSPVRRAKFFDVIEKAHWEDLDGQNRSGGYSVDLATGKGSLVFNRSDSPGERAVTVVHEVAHLVDDLTGEKSLAERFALQRAETERASETLAYGREYRFLKSIPIDESLGQSLGASLLRANDYDAETRALLGRLFLRAKLQNVVVAQGSADLVLSTSEDALAWMLRSDGIDAVAEINRAKRGILPIAMAQSLSEADYITFRLADAARARK